MILAKHNTIRLIGFEGSTMTQEAQFFITQEFNGQVEIISPEDFIISNNKDQYSYIVAFNLDTDLRQQVITILDSFDLDCIIYIHPTVVKYFADEQAKDYVGAGSFISPYSTMLLGSKLGKHCVVETYCLISHYVEIGDNTHMHVGTMIAGKSTIGKNCMFNFKSTVLNALKVEDNVELGAMSCITKDTLLPGKYVGTPARRIGNRITFSKGN